MMADLSSMTYSFCDATNFNDYLYTIKSNIKLHTVQFNEQYSCYIFYNIDNTLFLA